MELAEPSIGTAVAKLASAGCRTAVIAPYFLSRGRHITTDIPALVAEAQVAHPEVRCIIAEPIGAHGTVTKCSAMHALGMMCIIGRAVAAPLPKIGVTCCTGLDPLMAQIIESRVAGALQTSL